MFSGIKKPPVRNSKEADAVVALRPHFPIGYHLAQLQVGGTSVLSNAKRIISNFWQIVNGIHFPVIDRGWFDIKKSTNEFYFKGSTRDSCMNACKNIVSDLSNVSLDKLTEKKFKLVNESAEQLIRSI